MPEVALLLINLAATWFMAGLIWFVQVVHYPLFAAVRGEPFGGYHKLHVRRTTWVVAPVMLVELATAMALLAYRPPAVSGWIAGAGVALLAVAWGSTALLQVPRHHALAKCYDEIAWRSLCRTNWLRTIAWTARGTLMGVAIVQAAAT